MKKHYIFSAIITALMLFSCSKEMELQKSIFIEDPDYPGLPKYSEWGYNTFGAYYDRETFVSGEKIPLKIISTNDTTSIIFNGHLGSSYYYSDNNMSLTFKMPDFIPEKYSDLAFLNDSVFDLKNSNCTVIITIDDDRFNAQILNGEIHFKRAQYLVVDKKETEVILSGVFNFQALIGNEPVTMSEGRFDVGISNDNFFRY